MISLANKYRPKTFSDVVEQNVIKAILQNQINTGDIKNCYLFCGPAGTGKAQPLDSLVLTDTGYIQMGSVKVGTKVFTRKGNLATVSNVYPQGKRDVYKITFNDNTSIKVADNHLNIVYTVDANGNKEKDQVLETPALLELFSLTDYKICVDRPVIQFKSVEVEASPYYVGYVTGSISDRLMTTGIPNVFLMNDIKTRMSVLYGIMDASNVHMTFNGIIDWHTKDKQLSKDIEFLVRSLGFIDTVMFIDSEYRHMIEVDRSVDTDEYFSNKIHRYITNIEYIGKEYCQCIYVDDRDHTYISNDFIPTHNTTNARLFAEEVNEHKGTYTELDAASHNGVADIRKLIEDSRFSPIGQKYRVFIIDESHCLSAAAFSSALKHFEEPTPTSIFIMATTDPQKIPVTILSRVQRFDFQKISQGGIIERLAYIIDAENNEGREYTYDDDAITYIAKLSEGGMRDAISLMEKALSFSNNLTLETVVSALGTVSYVTMFDLTDAICKMDKMKVIEIVEKLHWDGVDLKQFIKDYNNFVLDLCKYNVCKSFDFVQIPKTFSGRMKYSKEEYAFFTTLLNEVMNLSSSLKWEATPKPLIESTFILLCSEG